MKKALEVADDDEISKQVQVYFTLLRKETGKCAVPSKIEDEILHIIRYSMQSSNPLSFLQSNGLVFFDKCCGVNMSVLCKKIISCRSRVSASFRREKWASSFSDEHVYKQLMQSFLPAGDIRNWSFRVYPNSSKIAERIPHLKQIIHSKPEPVVPIEKKIEESREAFELTLQKDIFSWTFFDEF